MKLNLNINFKKWLFYIFFLILIIERISCEIDQIFKHTENFRKNKVRKCSHEKKSYKKNYYNSLSLESRKASEYFNEISFEKIRIYFDYTFTLPHEEKILKELIIPPVQNFYENTLSVRRLPGKIRIPKTLQECQEIPVPKYLQEDGADADLIILITTYRGLKKYKYEKIFGFESINIQTNNTLKSQILNNYLDNFFKNKPNNRIFKKNKFDIKNGDIKFQNENFSDKINNQENQNNSLGNNFISSSQNNHQNISTFSKNISKFNNSINQQNNDTNINKSLLITEDGNSTEFNNSTYPWEINDGPSDTVGWSSFCLQDVYTLRPIVGVMQYISDVDPSPRAIEEAVWTTMHEFAHVFAMDYDLYNDFVDENLNRKGYVGTIKMKSKLAGLEKLIKERGKYFDELEKFSLFNTTKNSLLEEKLKKSGFDKANTNLLDELYIRFQEIDEQKNPNKVDFQNEKISSFYKNMSKAANSIIKIKSNPSSNLSIIEVPVNEFQINLTNTVNIPLTSSDSSLDPLKDYIYISDYFANNKSHNISEIQTNFNLTGPFDITTSLELEYNFTRITLPLLEEYLEVDIPRNLNITTLIYYISNFAENTRLYIKTPNVVAQGKLHFKCEFLDGVELEHFGGIGSAYSHWSKRILNTDFMIADSYGENYISNFTLALFEDSGWYKVDYSKSEQLLWGRNKGCKFLSEKCVGKKEEKSNFLKETKNRIPVARFKEEFCVSKHEELCSISKIFRAFCSIEKNSFLSVPLQYQYFEDPNVSGSSEFGDYCPYPVEWMDNTYRPIGSCKNGIKLRHELGEKICENCRCFISSLIQENVFEKNTKLYSEKISSIDYLSIKNEFNNTLKNFYENSLKNMEENKAVCYEAKCRRERGKVSLLIYIDQAEIKCPRNGGILSIEGYKGFIECPKVDSVCTGVLDPLQDHNKSSAYNLFSHMTENLLNIIYEFVYSLFNKIK